MSDDECEQFLLGLPGVGTKVARCVMMYSLDRQVFPVDTHCWRICRRLGWVRRTTPDGNCSRRDADRLQSRIPPELRRSLHVNMVSLGKRLCLAGSPRCDECPIGRLCRRTGV
jgi:endonuclease III